MRTNQNSSSAIPPKVPGAAIFEHVPDLGKPVVVTAGVVDVETFNPSRPMLVKLPAEAVEGMTKGGVKIGLDEFKKAFARSSQRAKDGRAIQRLIDGTENHETVKGHFGVAFPDKLHASAENAAAFKDVGQWFHFGIAEGRLDADCEQDMMATLRFSAERALCQGWPAVRVRPC